METQSTSVIIATNDQILSDRLVRLLREFRTDVVTTSKELWIHVRNEEPDLVIIDHRLTPQSVAVLKRRLVASDIAPDVLELSESGSFRSTDSIPIDTGDESLVAEVFARLHRREAFRKTSLIGRSDALYRIAELILQAAPSTISILIEGESGTGKELVARAIHSNSKVAAGPFIAANCGSFAEGVLESELFGHERGAFTGATGRRQGVFELSKGGTIFLDEVGELSFGTQVKLLRVLEQREFMRVGGAETITTDARVIAATNKDLARAVEQGKFRQDLFFRLCVVRIDISPLRDRPEDVEPLFWHFFRQLSQKHDIQVPRISRAAMEKLMRYSWPGNVRQLRNFVESLSVLKKDGEINVEDVDEYIIDRGYTNTRLPVIGSPRQDQIGLDLIWSALMALRQEIAALRRELGIMGWSVPFKEVQVDEENHEPLKSYEDQRLPNMEEVEREMIEKALRQAHGNRRKAADILGIGERTLYRRIQKYDLQDVK